MKFIDESIITVKSGNGGAGCTSFRRERYVEKGGPDGGNGGNGGNVIVKIDKRKRTLFDCKRQKFFKAQNGEPGKGKQKDGKNGSHCIISLPEGTIVSNAQTQEILIDLTNTKNEYIIAFGGRGGKGNKHFATSTNRAPRFSQPGIEGIEKKLKLELKLIADVGLIGLPNAGKSTLIKAMSAAKPKIADYPFTTLIPNLGVVNSEFSEPFVVADIPGIIKGAHKGAGLGIKFLKHIERTSLIVCLIDSSLIKLDSPLNDYNLINNEIKQYSQAIAKKPQIIVLNKIDLIQNQQSKIKAFKKVLKNKEVVFISALTRQGVDKLIKLLSFKLEKIKK